MSGPKLVARIGLDTSGLKKQSRTLKKVFRDIDRNISKPLKNATRNLLKLTAVAAAGAAAFAAYGLKMAGSFDKLQLRLKTVTGDAEKAQKAFDETFKLFVGSPLELEPLVEARILLESFGVTGAKALKNAAEAAAAMDRPVQDIASAIGSMETEPLRRLGIEVRKAGDAFTFSFLDKAGKAMTVVADGIQNARKEALNIFSIKFGGGLEELARSWPGAMSTFSGASKAAIAQMSDALKTQLLPLLIKLNDFIVAGLSDGTFRKWGQSFADAVRPAIEFILRLGKAFLSMTHEQRHALGQSLSIFAGALVAMKLGFFVPFKMLLAQWVAHSATAAATIASTLAGLAGVIAGYHFGDALAAKFDLGGIGNIRKLEKRLEKMRKEGLGGSGQYMQLLKQWQIETQKHDDAVGNAKGKRMGELFLESLGKTATKLVPEQFKDLFDAFDGTKVKMPSLPELTESGALAADLGTAAASMAAISKLAAPLRGFATGNINAALSRRPAETSQQNRTGAAMVKEQQRTNDYLAGIARGGNFSFA